MRSSAILVRHSNLWWTYLHSIHYILTFIMLGSKVPWRSLTVYRLMITVCLCNCQLFRSLNCEISLSVLLRFLKIFQLLQSCRRNNFSWNNLFPCMSEIIAFDPKVWDMPIMCESYMYWGIHFIVHNRMNFMIKNQWKDTIY